MTLQSNLEDIIDQLNDIKEDLISVLLTKKDKTTNNSFNVNNKTLIELCAMTRNISATVKNTAVIPTPATEIAKPDIYSTHIDILNKIQYCNNLLRYTLKIYGVNFYNSNKLHELVKFLNQYAKTQRVIIRVEKTIEQKDINFLAEVIKLSL